ncbi:BCCT family transporter, partial [Bacillus sp. SIMBA_161]
EVTLGLGAPIITYDLSALLNIDVTFGLTLMVTIVWVALFSRSAYLGVEKGIKRLSTFNIYLAGAFTVFILLAGPGVFILNYFSDS